MLLTRLHCESLDITNCWRRTNGEGLVAARIPRCFLSLPLSLSAPITDSSPDRIGNPWRGGRGGGGGERQGGREKGSPLMLRPLSVAGRRRGEGEGESRE